MRFEGGSVTVSLSHTGSHSSLPLVSCPSSSAVRKEVMLTFVHTDS